MANPSIYLFYGTENYLIEQAISSIINKRLSNDEKDMNFFTYDLLNEPLENVVEEAETLPFIAGHKVVLAKNALLFTGQKLKIEHDLAGLEHLIQSPPDYSTIIFWVPYEKLDERKKIVKRLKEQGTIKSFNTLKGEELLGWIQNKGKEEKVSITEEAAELLVNTSGPDLKILAQEIKKMAIFVGENGKINKGVVEELGARTMEQNVFALSEHLANLQYEQAFTVLYDLLLNKEEPVKIIALLARQFRIMLLAKEMYQKGYSHQQIGSQIGAHPYAIKIALQQSTAFSDLQLKKILKQLAEIDYEIKTGRKEKVLALEMFIFYLKNVMQSH